MKKNIILCLGALMMLIIGISISSCSSSDDEENDKIIDFDKYKAPSDTIIGSWGAIIGSWELIESAPKTQTSVVVSFTKDKSWKATYSNPTGVPFQTVSASTFDYQGSFVIQQETQPNDSPKWILKLYGDKPGGYEQDDYSKDYVIDIIGDKMYLMSWGFNYYTTYYTFQRI